MAARQGKAKPKRSKVSDLKPRKTSAVKGGGVVKKVARETAETVHNYRPPHYV